MRAILLAAGLTLGACQASAPSVDPARTKMGAEEHDGAPAYVGVWAHDPGHCANPQEIYEAPLIFTDTGYDRHETHCDFDHIVEIDPATWRIDLSCSVEGDEQIFTEFFTVDGDTMVRSGEQGGPGWTLSRCFQDAGAD